MICAALAMHVREAKYFKTQRLDAKIRPSLLSEITKLFSLKDPEDRNLTGQSYGGSHLRRREGRPNRNDTRMYSD